MLLYNMTKEDLENNADAVKALVLTSLAKECLLDEVVAEEWAETHTVILRKKGFFRTLTDRWRKEVESESDVMLVVKQIT